MDRGGGDPFQGLPRTVVHGTCVPCMHLASPGLTAEGFDEVCCSSLSFLQRPRQARAKEAPSLIETACLLNEEASRVMRS